MTETPASEPNRTEFWRRTRKVAFWSVLVGIALELVILALVAIGKSLPETARALAQVASKVSWPAVVCFGISCGLTATGARAGHKGTLQAISHTPTMTVIELGARGVNELAFPVGCASVLFLAKRTSAAVRGA